MTEIIILKVLFIYMFSAITAVNECFLKQMIVSFNIVVIGVLFISRITLKEHQTSSRPWHIFRSQDATNPLNVRTEAQDNIVK